MIEELEELVAAFPGEPGRTRCFAHILNLIAKSIIKQFDVPKAKKGEVMDDALKELITLAGNIELEERLTREGETDDDDDNIEDDNEEGWIDERENMSREDQDKLNEDVQPVRLVLVKVRALLIGINISLIHGPL
jgi:hypothetical protein